MSGNCYVLLVGLIYIILMILYICIMTESVKKKDTKEKKVIDFRFKLVVIGIAFSSLIGCVPFMSDSNAKEYFVVYFVLFVLYMLIINIYKTDKSFEEYLSFFFKRVIILLLIIIVLSLVTIILEKIIIFKDVVISRVVVLFIICSLCYLIKTLVEIICTDDENIIKIINTLFDIVIPFYICSYILVYLVQDNPEDVVGKIITCASLIMNLFDKRVKIEEYFSNCNSTNKSKS